MIRNGIHEGPGGFLDKNDIKIGMGFKNHFDDKIVFSDVL